MQVSQLQKIIPIIKPQDITAGIVSDVVNLAKWNHVTIVIQNGVWAGGTSTLTVEACSDNAGTISPVMDFNFRTVVMDETADSDVWGALTFQTSTGLTLDTTNTAVIIELDAADVYANRVATVAANDGYHHVRIELTNPAQADFTSAFVILSQYRYAKDLLDTALD